MAPAALPLAKLASLLIKTLAKPVAKRIKSQGAKIDFTKKSLVWVGQTSHALTTRMTIWSSGYKVRSIAKIEEEAALTRGADIMSEAFIFSVSGALLVYEYHRSSEKDRKKEEAKHKQITDDAKRLQANLDSLDKRLVALEHYAEANRRTILERLSVSPFLSSEYTNDQLDSQEASREKEKPPKTPRTETRSWTRWLWPF